MDTNLIASTQIHDILPFQSWLYVPLQHTYVQYVHTHTHTHLCVRVWHPTHLGRWSHSDLHQSAWSGVRGCHDSKQNEPGSHVLYINKPWENLYQSTIALWQSNESSLRTYVRTHVWPWKYVYTLCTYIHRHVHIYIRPLKCLHNYVYLQWLTYGDRSQAAWRFFLSCNRKIGYGRRIVWEFNWRQPKTHSHSLKRGALWLRLQNTYTGVWQ